MSGIAARPRVSPRWLEVVLSVVLVALATACDDGTSIDIPDCGPCGMVLLEVSAQPVNPQAARVDFYVTTRALNADLAPSYDFLGLAHSFEPGPIEVSAGLPWGASSPPGDTMSVWVAVNWLEDQVSIDRDSTIALVRLRPWGEPRLYDTVSVVLSK